MRELASPFIHGINIRVPRPSAARLRPQPAQTNQSRRPQLATNAGRQAVSLQVDSTWPRYAAAAAAAAGELSAPPTDCEVEAATGTNWNGSAQ